MSVPTHLGLILDGNRRWAVAAGLAKLEGHREGYTNLHKIVVHAMRQGVKYISAYVFSTENWSRSEEEVNYLMDLLVWVATNEIDKYAEENLKVVVLGSRARLSDKVLAAIETAEQRTRHNTGATVALCLNYGGRLELAEGVARLVEDGVPAAAVTPEKLAEYLYHPEIPPVDLIIRTSGEMRLSNFMLWRAAYAELYFVEAHWPAFGSEDLDAALEEFGRRRRRYGK